MKAAGVPGRARNQHGAARDLALLDHLQHNRSGLAGLFLPDQALGCSSGLKSIRIDAEATDVRVRGDEVEPAELFTLGDGDDGLHRGAVRLLIARIRSVEVVL